MPDLPGLIVGVICIAVIAGMFIYCPALENGNIEKDDTNVT